MDEADGWSTADGTTTGLASAEQAFEAIASERRLGVLAELVDGEGRDRTRTFTELFEASNADTTAGFAYHLRQLDGTFVRETDSGYTLTYAGRAVLDAIRAGEFTDRVDREPIELEESCPLCHTAALSVESNDNVLTVECSACDRSVLSFPFPPAGLRAHSTDAIPDVFDAQQRHRIELASEGVCPTCGGPVDAGVDRVPVESAVEAAGQDRAVGQLACRNCGFDLSVPVTLCVRDHPAVVAFYHEHGIDVRDRPLWNVGDEWRETVVSTDPWVSAVSTRIDDHQLILYVDEDLTVQETRRVRPGTEAEGRLGEGEPLEGEQPAAGNA